MACRGCGKKLAGMRCCLCGRNVLKPPTPWGTKRKICSYCKDKQLALIEERKKMNKRAEILMQGKDYAVKDKKVKGLVKK
jgi:hypothetical protein